MDNERETLRDRLRKVEALYEGAATEGERAAAGEAVERIRARLKQIEKNEPPIEIRFEKLFDPWERKLFTALCRRYGLKPVRRKRMKRQTILVKAPKSFIDNVLWPEFVQLSNALRSYLEAVTNRVISEEVWRDVSEVEELPERG
jgi:hypothetical protein